MIAIVHWNRKRLPEQRVDLYDECVDVLLGQRKEAEHIQLSRKVTELDEQREEQTHEERAWVRKRFAEIALHILAQDGDRDEATKADVIKLLMPRFIDQGAVNEEQASTRADLFLDRQELRSGLLVSRRAQSYRFVHLTFQEYLAAWQLSNMDFDNVAQLMQSRLRLAKWFETWQLLGGQWAKESDDKVDRFVAWLLENRGATINDQAPVVALCANIVKDISGIAELKPPTRRTFKEAVEATLAAFREGSGIPAKTQLEILAALGQLGGAVKSNLIDATKASLFQVRRLAIEMLLPHLSDDDLFSLDHILKDRSREPIFIYIQALIDRNEERSIQLIINMPRLSEKCGEGILKVFQTGKVLKESIARRLLTHVGLHCQSSSTRIRALLALTRKWPDERTRELLEARAVQDENFNPRRVALQALAEKWPDERTHELIEDRAVQDKHFNPRRAALQALAEKWPDERTRELLEARAAQDEHDDPRRAALQALAEKWPDERTRELIEARAVQDENDNLRRVALQALAEKWPDERTRELIEARAVQDENDNPRRVALQALAEKWPDERTRELIEARAVQDENDNPRRVALQALAEKWPDERTRELFKHHAVDVNFTNEQRGLLCVLLGKMHSEFGQIVFTRYYNSMWPYLDSRKPLARDHIEQAAKRAGVPIDKLDETIRSLSAHMGWDITKGLDRG